MSSFFDNEKIIFYSQYTEYTSVLNPDNKSRLLERRETTLYAERIFSASDIYPEKGLFLTIADSMLWGHVEYYSPVMKRE